MAHDLKVDGRVWWTDPDRNLGSGAGTITHVQHDEDDAVIAIQMDGGSTVEAPPHELIKLKKTHVRLVAFTRLDYEAEVEFPETMEDTDAADLLLQEVDGSDFVDDRDYWEDEAHIIEPNESTNRHTISPASGVYKKPASRAALTQEAETLDALIDDPLVFGTEVEFHQAQARRAEIDQLLADMGDAPDVT